MSDQRAQAQERFRSEPGKCFQRHMREVYAEIESVPGPVDVSLKTSGRVAKITRQQAASIILKYEWLGTLGANSSAFYGLFINDMLAGVAVFGKGASAEALNVCGEEYASSAICLMRGACVPWAPKNAASFLIRGACKQASIDYGWKIFFAYSDAEAGEIGTVYQASNWKYIGAGAGAMGAGRLNWRTAEGKIYSSQNVQKRLKMTRMQCLARGWHPVTAHHKGKYVWFEDRSLEKLCRYPFVAYPKRQKAAA
jgi:hypothetical protein